MWDVHVVVGLDESEDTSPNRSLRSSASDHVRYVSVDVPVRRTLHGDGIVNATKRLSDLPAVHSITLAKVPIRPTIADRSSFDAYLGVPLLRRLTKPDRPAICTIWTTPSADHRFHQAMGNLGRWLRLGAVWGGVCVVFDAFEGLGQCGRVALGES